MRNKEINNSEDILDSRDIIARIEELQSEREDLETAVSEAETDETLASHGDGVTGQFSRASDEAKSALGTWDASEEADELKTLLTLQNEAENYSPDWKYGTPLIRDSYFVEYCEDLCKDIGDVPKDIPSYVVIDWDATAENIKVDYTEVDFDGAMYFVR